MVTLFFLGMGRVLDPNPGITRTQSSVGRLPSTEGPMASPLTGSPQTVIILVQDPGNPPMTGDCQHPDTASSPEAQISDLIMLATVPNFSDFFASYLLAVSSELCGFKVKKKCKI